MSLPESLRNVLVKERKLSVEGRWVATGMGNLGKWFGAGGGEGGAVVAWRSRNMVITVTNRVPFGRSATKSVNSEQMSPTLVGNWSLIKTRK